MEKIKEFMKFKIIEEVGYWYVLHSGAVSGRMFSKYQANEYIKAHFEQAQVQFGDKYEVILKVL